MTTIIERDVSGDGGISSALTAIVAIVAILIVVGVALYLLRGVYPFNTMMGATTTPTVDVNIKGVVPGTNPSGQ